MEENDQGKWEQEFQRQCDFNKETFEQNLKVVGISMWTLVGVVCHAKKEGPVSANALRQELGQPVCSQRSGKGGES